MGFSAVRATWTRWVHKLRLGGAAALATAALLGGGGADPRRREVAPPQLTVEFTGCGAVLAGPLCELPRDGAIRLWVKAAEGARVQVTLDGALLSAGGARVQGGQRIEVTAPPDAKALQVRAELAGGRAGFTLTLRPPAPLDALNEVQRLRRQGALADAEQLAQGPARAPEPGVRARALGQLARLELMRGQVEPAIERFEEAIRLDRAAGRLSDEFEDRFALTHTLIYNGRRFAAARRALEELQPLEASYPEGRTRKAYYAALLSAETGNRHAALRQLRTSAEGAERLGLDLHRLEVVQYLADLTQQLGRAREARALLRELRYPADASPCLKASLLNDVGWNALQVAQAEGRQTGLLAEAAKSLQDALELYAGPCPNPAERSSTLSNLALVSLEEGAPDEARRYLEEARRQNPATDARLSAGWLDLEGRIALARGAPAQAMTAYERLQKLAESAAPGEGRWSAALGRGRALEALGRPEAAAAAYAQAEAVLDEESLLVPLGEGRGTFLGRFEESARRLVDVLLDRDPRAALSAARRARGRALRALGWRDRLEELSAEERTRWEEALVTYRREQEALEEEARDDWRLPADRLVEAKVARAARERRLRGLFEETLAVLGRSGAVKAGSGALLDPTEDELVLVVHPIREGWAGFGVTRGRIEARRLGDLDPAAPLGELAERLLMPFRDQVARAGRISVVLYGKLERVEVHALPWEGRPLIAHAPVVYRMDLAERTRQAGPGDSARAALLVADPRSDLPAARSEATLVAALLAEQGLRVDRLWGEAATRTALLQEIDDPAVSLLHYAGHGFFGGRDGWESGLVLAQGGALSVGDVLALRRVPRHVVLSGCSMAQTEAEAPVAGLGLAQAFLVAGSDWVVASTQPVGDRLAEQTMRAFYEATREAGTEDAGALLREIVLQVTGKEGSPSEGASFRVLVR